MHFIVYSEDKDDALPIRQANRDAHLAWLAADNGVDVLTAGPWLDDERTMRGSLLIVDAPDEDAVNDWLQSDPYRKAGLTASVTVKAFKWTIGAPT